MFIYDFIVILKEIKLFLFISDQLCAKDYLDFLEKKENIGFIALLTHVFKHINNLNLKSQERGNLVCDLLSEIKRFLKQIDFLCEDVENECLYFFYLKTIFNNYESIDISQFVNFIKIF